MLKPFSSITTSSHDIVIQMQKVTHKNVTSVSYSNCENVMKDDKLLCNMRLSTLIVGEVYSI
jgi:hypothetical protein